MIEHSGAQVLCLLLCGGFGVVCGLGLDLLTLLTPPRAPRWVVAVRDAVAVVIAALALFLLSLPLTAGRLRWFLFAGAGLGLWVYHATAHRIVMAVGRRVRRWLTGAARWVSSWYDRLVVRPMKQRILRPLGNRMRTLVSKRKPRRPKKPSPAPRSPKKSRSKTSRFSEKLSKNY